MQQKFISGAKPLPPPLHPLFFLPLLSLPPSHFHPLKVGPLNPASGPVGTL